MKRIIILSITLFAISLNTYSQENNVKLLGETADGKTVKLMWFLKSWDKDLIGFNIKRKDESGNWALINKQTIVPEISVSKKLENVESDAVELGRLNKKLQQLIQDKHTKEVSSANYIQKLTDDPNALKAVAFTIALDYDMALLNGFGMVDRSSSKGKYQYGLFLVRKNKEDEAPAATYSFEYGVKTNLSPSLNVSSLLMNKKGIQLKWNVTSNNITEMNAAGFNVYKQSGNLWMKLNKGLVSIGNSTNTKYTFFDTTATIKTNNKYAVSLVSMFNNEGDKVAYSYNPEEHPLEHKVPELTDIKSAGENFANGRKVSWTFPVEYEKYVKEFVLEKANLPEGFKDVQTISDIHLRFIDDNTFSPPAAYLKYRLKAIYKDDIKLSGNEKLYYFLPVIYAPKPEHLIAKVVRDQKKVFVDLNWNAKPATDSLTSGYQLFVTDPFDGKMYLEGSIPLISENRYRYEIKNVHSATYRFVVAAVSKYKAVGQFSDTVSVTTPSLILPVPALYPQSQDTGRVTLTWKYDNISDLKGFRLLQNGNIVQSEYELKKDARMFVTPKLKIGATYKFNLQAVAVDGTISELSMPQEIYIFNKEVKKKGK